MPYLMQSSRRPAISMGIHWEVGICQGVKSFTSSQVLCDSLHDQGEEVSLLSGAYTDSRSEVRRSLIQITSLKKVCAPHPSEILKSSSDPQQCLSTFHIPPDPLRALGPHSTPKPPTVTLYLP